MPALALFQCFLKAENWRLARHLAESKAPQLTELVETRLRDALLGRKEYDTLMQCGHVEPVLEALASEGEWERCLATAKNSRENLVPEFLARCIRETAIVSNEQVWDRSKSEFKSVKLEPLLSTLTDTSAMTSQRHLLTHASFLGSSNISAPGWTKVLKSHSFPYFSPQSFPLSIPGKASQRFGCFEAAPDYHGTRPLWFPELLHPS